MPRALCAARLAVALPWAPVAAGVLGLSGYGYTDPAAFGGFWAEESALEARLPEAACDCRGRSGEVSWPALREELRRHLDADPAFTGAWVHSSCGTAYSTLFAHASLDPESDQLSVRGTQCTAGLASIAAICARSAALRGGGHVAWRRHEAVVIDEGDSVGDYWGAVPLAECARRCEETPGCNSVAHGPFGCHLKARCAQAADPLTPLVARAPGYRTYSLADCREEGAAVVAEAPGAIGEVALLLDLALHLAERGTHCMEASAWPLTPAELVANRVRLAEALLGSGGAAGAGPELRALEWAREAAPMAVSGEGAVRRALQRATIRWARRLNSEVGFWHILLTPPASGSPPPERDEEDAAAARRWLETGEVQWSWDPEASLCARLATTRGCTATYGRPRLLNTGSGPLAPGPVDCSGTGDLGLVPVVATDGLARFYLQLYDHLSLEPPRVPSHCPVEELRRCFPRNHFDLVFMRNALDHAMDPLLGIRQMLEVVRPGGWVLLRHARNEGSPGMFQVGLHQWSFDAVRADGAKALHFLVWNPALRADATQWLLDEGLAVEVRTELRPHPGAAGGDGADAEGEYIFVDIQKPP